MEGETLSVGDAPMLPEPLAQGLEDRELLAHDDTDVDPLPLPLAARERLVVTVTVAHELTESVRDGDGVREPQPL